RPPTAVADTADGELAARRYLTDQRPQKPASRILGRDAQRIRGSLEGVADPLQRQADQPARVVLAADQMALQRAEDVATEFGAEGLRRVQEADAVDAPRPGVRNVDGGGRPRRRRLAAVEGVDEAEVDAGPHMVQLVERL